MVAEIIYILCAVTSLACAVMLWNGYRKTRGRLLFWGGLAFAGLFLNNLLLIVDTSYPAVDMALWRTLPGLAGILILLYGLIWEVEQ